ncbi:MAG: translation initiation factor IF-2 [Candidatus Micrarchaeota archaeon]|nr:translation initiation factor IF-2 [Candidatus Micrarchaeota archaeon]
MAIRSPIVCILAHVDHGKTSLLDYIRGSAIAKKEPGAITQMIGAYYLPKKTIIDLSAELGQKIKDTLQVPGILFIDTPGHEAFTSMRQRGGSISDIAILVVDISQGVQNQTIESLEILLRSKVPFLVALNKVDLLYGWKPQPTTSISSSLLKQSEKTIEYLEERTYTILDQLKTFNIRIERFDRISDFTKEIVAVPCSAKTGEGIAELLLYLAGLTQKYLASSLSLKTDCPAKGSILELKEEKGLGTTIDVIIYEGKLKKNDLIAFASIDGPRKTKVRGIFKPAESSEKSDQSQKFVSVDEVVAAAGVKLYAQNLEGALAGSPLYALEDEKEFAKIEQEIKKTVNQILIKKSDFLGVIVKTDTLGSAEAFLNLLTSKNIPIKEISIGPITKKDVLEAFAVAALDKYLGAILAFNVDCSLEVEQEAQKRSIKIFNSKIIFESFENYISWVKEEKEKEKLKVLCSINYPVKLKVLPNCFFRACKPAIFGVEILAGKLKPKTTLVKGDGTIIGEVKTIQNEGQNIEQASQGQKVAISIDECYCGKTIKELDILFSYIPPSSQELIKKHCLDLLTKEELSILDEISKILKK